MYFSVVVTSLGARFLEGVAGRGKALIGLAILQLVVFHSRYLLYSWGLSLSLCVFIIAFREWFVNSFFEKS
jgi:hypothetical protein